MKNGKFGIPGFSFHKSPEETEEKTADEQKEEKTSEGKAEDVTSESEDESEDDDSAEESEDEEDESESDSEEDEEEESEEEQDEEEVREIETQLARVRSKIDDLIQNHRLAVLIGGVICLALLLYFLIHTQTYTNVSVLETKAIQGAVNCSYTEFQKGFLKYSQDGAAYISTDGSDKWNQAYLMANPFVEINGKTGIVADKQGNSVLVFQKSGMIGQFETTLPIEKAAVSKQGIVGLILRDDNMAIINCYDSVGNLLVEHKTSFGSTGYPLDVALSDNGQTMMVTYLYAAKGVITTKVNFFNFSTAGENKADHMIGTFEYPGTISASCFFIKGDTGVVVGDNKLIYYSGLEEPKQNQVIELDEEVKNLSHTDEEICLVTKNVEEGGYHARLYNNSGKMTMSADFTGEYNNIKICDKQILMYDGRQCSVILDNGVQKFKGEMENTVLELIPESGVNRYMLVDQDGFKKIRLVK